MGTVKIMKEFVKARIICGVISIFYLFYYIFVTIPEIYNLISVYNADVVKTVMPVILEIGFFASIALWSLGGVIKFDESDS
jgi:hypothetical protein